MSDLISRKAAIDALRRCRVIDVKNMLIAKDDAMKYIMTLPSAQPEMDCQKCIFCGFAGFKQFQREQE